MGGSGGGPPHPHFGFYCRRQPGAQGSQPSRTRTDGTAAPVRNAQKYHTGSPHCTHREHSKGLFVCWMLNHRDSLLKEALWREAGPLSGQAVVSPDPQVSYGMLSRMKSGRTAHLGLGQAGMHLEHLNFLLGHSCTEHSWILLVNFPRKNGTTVNARTPLQLCEPGALAVKQVTSVTGKLSARATISPVSLGAQTGNMVTTQVGELISQSPAPPLTCLR